MTRASLSLRLSFTLVALMALFVLVFSGYFFLTDRYRWERDDRDQDDRRAQELLLEYRTVNRYGGSADVLRTLDSEPWRSTDNVGYVDVAGHWHLIVGKLARPSEELERQIRSGAQVVIADQGRERTLLVPVLGRQMGEVDGILCVERGHRRDLGPPPGAPPEPPGGAPPPGPPPDFESGRSWHDRGPPGPDQNFFAAFLLASLTCASATYFLCARMVRPLRDIERATAALAEDRLHVRLPVRGPGELARLCEEFNRMADHLESTIGSLQQAKERAELSEQSKKSFLAEASHNLRTPLSAMLGWTEALLDGLVPGEETAHLQRIRREVLHCSRTVHRLLDLSRRDFAEMRLSLETLPLSEPLMDVIESLESEAEAKQMELTLHGLEGEPRVVADRTRLRELLQILLENAVQHNLPGTRLEVGCELEGTRVYRISVSDSGKGLPESVRRDLSSRPGGRLGLSIAAEIARAHGGQLEAMPIESGSRITFTLRRAEEADEANPAYR